MITANALLIDIGGTSTEVEFKNKKQKFNNNKFNSFEELLANYLINNPVHPNALAIGAAGPVKNKICKLTNLPWSIDIEKIRQSFFPYLSKDKVFLLNDLEAFAWYPMNIKETSSEIIRITNDTPWVEKGNYSVIAVGTGLGAAMAFYNQKEDTYQVVPTESGHTTRTIENKKNTWEDFLSGQGLVDLYNSLDEIPKEISNTRELNALVKDKDPLAIETINIFFYNLGIFAQNIALTMIPQKGIYLSGGIVSVFYSFCDKSILIESFRDNNKMKYLLQEIPLYLVEDSAPLKGLRQLP